MCQPTTRTIGSALLAILLFVPLTEPAVAQVVTRVSVSSSGEEADQNSFSPVITPNGRHVAFASPASNLVADDTGGWTDIFVHDRHTGQTIRVSVSSDGVEGDERSYEPEISADGRFVAFYSKASNLAPDDTNGEEDVFVHDVLTGETARVSVSSAGVQGNGRSKCPSISAGGRYVVFHSTASNLVDDHTNGVPDIFVRDRETGETTRVSVSTDGIEANGGSFQPSISADGWIVAFQSDASNLVAGDTNGVKDIFVHDRFTGETVIVSVDSQGTLGNNDSLSARVSVDGYVIAFVSLASNLVPDDYNSAKDVFVHDLDTAITSRVSIDSDGMEVNAASEHGAISGDARYVSFYSASPDFVPDDANGRGDVFRHDRETGETILISVSSDGVQGNGDSGKYDRSPMSTDGAVVAFSSDASSLVPGDTNTVRDIFVWAGDCEPPAIVEQPQGQYVCTGEPATFSVTATGMPEPSYQWRKDGMDIADATEANYRIDAATADDAGTYDVVVSNDCGFVTSEAALLTVDTTFIAPPQDQIACDGHGATLSVVVGAPEPITYQWRKDGVEIPGATDPALVIDPVGYDDVGTYDVVATSQCDTATSDAATLTVIDPATITGQPTDQIACPGDTLTLTVEATGGGTLAYQWRRDGQVLSDQTDPVLYYDYVWEWMAGDYDVIVSNECSSVASDVATVIVPSGVIIITQHPQDQEVCEGQPATFSVSAESEAPLSYQWRKNGEDIPGATEPTYTIDSVTWDDFGEYSARVWDACASTVSDNGSLIVRLAPVIEEHPQSQQACQGATVTFSVTAGGWEPIAFQWRKDAVEIPDATQSTYTIDPVTQTDAGDYDVIVSNDCGSVTSDPATLTVLDDVVPTIVTQPETQTACIDGSATFSVVAEGTNLEYQWQKWVSPGDPKNPARDYVDIPGATEPSYIIEPVTWGDEGSYRVVVSNACGSVASVDVSLLIDDGVINIIQQPSDQIGCEGGSVTFEVIAQGTPPLSFQWRKDGIDIDGANERLFTIEELTLDDAGSYDVVIASTCGTATSDPALLTVVAYDPPVITVQPTDQTVCEGDEAALSVEAVGAEPLNHQWRRGGSDIEGATEATYVISPVGSGDAGDYDVVVTNPCGTTTSDTAALTVALIPVITRQPLDRDVGVGEGVTFIVEARGEALGYQWQKDGVDIPGATESTYTIEEVAPEDEGQYAVIVTNVCGSVSSDAATLTLLDYPHTRRASISSTGEQGDANSEGGRISGGGRYVAFVSSAGNLAPGLPGERGHVYLHDRQGLSTIRVTQNPENWQTNGDSYIADISPDEWWITFDSDAANIVPGDTNGVRDIFLIDIYNDHRLTRISKAWDGGQANGPSYQPAIANYGQNVVFHSDADNLVPDDTNGASDVFVYDRTANVILCVSVSVSGVPGNASSAWASISDDGRYAAFQSAADDLVPDDTNGAIDIFVRDLVEGTTTLVSQGADGSLGDGDSTRPVIAADGRWVAFDSAATNLVAGDGNEKRDVFVGDLGSGATILVSRATDGTLGDDDSYFAALSADGHRVAFLSHADNLVAGDTNGFLDVFLYDRDPDGNGVFDEGNEACTRVSVASNGDEANGPSGWPTLSRSGGSVVFESDATNLVDDDNNGSTDVFRHNTGSATTLLISVNSSNEQADGPSLRPSVVGAPLHYVLFSSGAANLQDGDENDAFDIFARDVQLSETQMHTRGWVADADNSDVEISADGRFITFESFATNLVAADENQRRDVFIYDAQSKTIELVSLTSDGQQADDNSYDPAVSADGRYVAFASIADNLLPSGESSTINVFVRDRVLETTEWVSVGQDGQQPNFQADDPAISGDGRFVAYHSAASNLVPDDTNGKADIFVYDRQTATTTRVSIDSAGDQADDDCTDARISADGRYVAFLSLAENLVPNDNNDQADVFVHDRQTGETTLVSVNLDGQAGSDGSGSLALSADGRYAAFSSGASDLVLFDQNQRVDVFVRDLQEHSTRLVSVDDLGQQGNGESYGPSVSADGRYITFASDATNLAPGDTNGTRDVFVHDTYGCLAPSILEHPIGQTIFVDQTFTLTVTAAGTRPWSFQWRKDGVEIPGATDDSLTVESPDPNDAGVYDVVVSNACGSVVSDGALVEVLGCQPVNEAISVSTGGGDLFDPSSWPSVSADARYIAFHTEADNIVPEDAFGYTDVFVRDRHTGIVTWISRSYDGRFGNATSARAALSADGRFVAFQSAADNIVEGDTNGYVDVFICDRDPDDNGTYDEGNTNVMRLSVGPDGEEANNESVTPAISADGRYVAFNSQATNLLPGAGGWIEHIYVRDLQTGELARVSVDDDGNAGDNDSRSPAISADGRYVAFRSYASNLVPNDANVYPDIFVHDRQTSTTTLVSSDANGGSVTGDNHAPSISADGRFVAFASDATLVPSDLNGAADIYVKDLQTGQIERVSVDSNGVEADAGSSQATISDTGRYVAFYSDATNLVTGDDNGLRDAFVHDRLSGITTLVSASGLDTPGNAPSGSGNGMAVAADAEWIAFVSEASDLVSDDTNSNQDVFLRNVEEARTLRVSVSGPGVYGSGDSRYASLSVEGRFVTFQSGAENLVPGDTNEDVDVFLHDRLTDQVRRLNVSPSGEQTPPYNDNGFPVVSADGRYVAYYSTADTIVPEDTNGRRDVFVYDVEAATNSLVSVSSAGEQGDRDSANTWYPIAISGDGRCVAFESSASNLVPDDTNEQPDIFVHDRDPDGNGVFDEGNGVTTRVNVDSDGNQTSGWSEKPSISADGRYVAFLSTSSGLVPNDNNGAYDIFVHDRQAGTTERVSIAADGAEANGDSDHPRISATGRYVVFASFATNLHPLDTNARRDVFVRDREAGTTLLASVNSAGEVANDHSECPAISGDGRFVSFHSYADNLVAGDTNAHADVFIRDLHEEITLRVSIRIDGAELSHDSLHPGISPEGGVIAFQTRGELVLGQINRGVNIFVHQRSDCLEPWIGMQPEDQTVPETGNATFEVIAGANPAPQYQWRKDGVDIRGATFRTITLENVGLIDAARYDVVVSNALGSVVSDPAVLTVVPSCPGDLDADGDVDLSDLAILLAHYGTIGEVSYYDGDLDFDGDVDLSDLAALLAVYGTDCP